MAWMAELMRDGDDHRVPVALCLDVGHQCVAGTTGSERIPTRGSSASVPRRRSSTFSSLTGSPIITGPSLKKRTPQAVSGPTKCLPHSTDPGRPVALVLEIVPPFEQDDEAVLTDLEASVRFWKTALAER